LKELDWYLQANLKMRQLRLLVAIDTYRNLTHVAEVTHVTVPAVSKSLAELERGLGLILFSRTLQGLVPTPYGECLVRHARAMLAILHEARDELKALKSGTEGKIHVGMLTTSASVLLPRARCLLKQRSPGTNVMVIEGTKDSLLPELWKGRLDLFVGRLPPTDALGTFEEKKLLEEPVMLVTGPGHPLAKKRNVQWADVRPYPWILPPPGTILRDPLERALEANDVALTANYIETFSMPILRAHLQDADYIAVMGATLIASATPALHVLPLRLPGLLLASGVLWNRNRGLSPSAQLLVSCLEEVAQGLQSELDTLS
jgi:DNA-binding transcriptional LysR family regulator